ncbi:MAG TPA: hypothetical protein VMV86_04835 [Methanosarcinales archaeon]|nr:hypothetical protein [Methanosarcinales archaeon]
MALHPYPSDIMTNCDGLFYCFAKWAYAATSGLFFTLMLMGFGAILIMGTQRIYGYTKAFGFGSFVCALAAVWLATMQLLDWWVASLFILIGAVGMVMLVMQER